MVDGLDKILQEPLPTAKSDAATDLKRNIYGRFPLLPYAVQKLLVHADAAEERKVSQRGFLNTFTAPASRQSQMWKYFYNLAENYPVRRHLPSVSLLYITSQQNLPALTQALL